MKSAGSAKLLKIDWDSLMNHLPTLVFHTPKHNIYIYIIYILYICIYIYYRLYTYHIIITYHYISYTFLSNGCPTHDLQPPVVPSITLWSLVASTVSRVVPPISSTFPRISSASGYFLGKMMENDGKWWKMMENLGRVVLKTRNSGKFGWMSHFLSIICDDCIKPCRLRPLDFPTLPGIPFEPLGKSNPYPKICSHSESLVNVG